MTKTVGTIETALRILQALERNNGMGVTELATTLDLPKSTVHSHLNTLQTEEYVVKDGREYALGLKFLKLGVQSRNRLAVYEHVYPEVDALAETSGEVVNVAVEEYGRGVYLYRAQGEKAVHLDTYSGMRFHLHCTALGKVMLAHLPEAAAREILDATGLPKRTENTITDPDSLIEEFERIEAQGFAYDDEERLPRLRCVAAPIVYDGRPIAAISIAGPTSRMKGERYDTELPEMVLNAANVVELNLKYE
jgi:DNA-binding IclR family transcriptional regulator